MRRFEDAILYEAATKQSATKPPPIPGTYEDYLRKEASNAKPPPR